MVQFLVATSDREALCTLESYKYYKYKYDFYQSTAPQLKHEIFHSDCLGGVDEIVQKTPKGRWEKLTQGASSFRSLPPSPGAAIMQVRKAIHVAAPYGGRLICQCLSPPTCSVSPKDGRWTIKRFSTSGLPHWNQLTVLLIPRCARPNVAAEKRRTSAKDGVSAMTRNCLACFPASVGVVVLETRLRTRLDTAKP